MSGRYADLVDGVLRGAERSAGAGLRRPDDEPGPDDPDGRAFRGRDLLQEEAPAPIRVGDHHDLPRSRPSSSVGGRVEEEPVPGEERGFHAPVLDDRAATQQAMQDAPDSPVPGTGEGILPVRRGRLRHLYPSHRECPLMFRRNVLRGPGSSLVAALRPAVTVRAHCDIPCGIYDPHEAQISALTVVRMAQLIGELPKPTGSSKPEEVEAYPAKLARYMLVKEQHAERVKSELRVIWADYFTPDHVKQHPTLHDSFFQAMKLASKSRQGTSLADAQALLAAVQSIAETFWTTKGAKTRRMPSMQKAGGEIVYPVPAA